MPAFDPAGGVARGGLPLDASDSAIQGPQLANRPTAIDGCHLSVGQPPRKELMTKRPVETHGMGAWGHTSRMALVSEAAQSPCKPARRERRCLTRSVVDRGERRRGMDRTVRRCLRMWAFRARELRGDIRVGRPTFFRFCMAFSIVPSRR